MPSWYHGTDAVLAPGDWIVPGDKLGRSNYPAGDSTAVWVCDDPHWAELWAGAALEMRGETGPGFVYEVEPATAPTLAAGDAGDGPQFRTDRARVVALIGTGTPGTPQATEGTAWCPIRAGNGVELRTNSYTDHPDGSAFVTIIDSSGDQLGWWPVDSWADPERAEAVMANLWATASRSETAWDDEYDVEYVVPLTNGQVRACPAGSYVRLLDGDGGPLDGGSAYWCSDEWVEDPTLVMGAILGAAAAIS